MRAPALPTLIKDTREPALEAGDREEALFRPWIFAPGQPRERPIADRERLYLPLRRATLETGDYSLEGLETVVAVERKSGPDLLSTLFGQTTDSLGEARAAQERFRAELERSRALAGFCIVVEASVAWLFTEAKRRFERYRKSFDPFRVLELTHSFAVDYGAETVWAGSKVLAEGVVGWRLARIWDEHTGGKSWKKAEQRGYAAALAWGPPEQLARYREEAPLEQPAIAAPAPEVKPKRTRKKPVREAVEELGAPPAKWRYGQ